MRIVYALLSPTFGMHQYTAHYANMLALAGHEVHLVTSSLAPRDRYATAVTIHTPLTTSNTGLSKEILRRQELQHTIATIATLEPDVVHITGPHIWNVSLVKKLKQQAIPVIHTIHDLDPHSGTRFGRLLTLWNRLIIRYADHLLVHGQCYRERLLSQGVAAHRVTFSPLLHLFLSHEAFMYETTNPEPITYEPFTLFFGRLERYKGVDNLLNAFMRINAYGNDHIDNHLILAGPGQLPPQFATNLPAGIDLRNRLITDAEALDLFRRCRLLVLPYIDATQSALIAAAYHFRKPVLVTRVGAFPEYVAHDHTGFIAESGNRAQLTGFLRQAIQNPLKMEAMGGNGRYWYDHHRQQEFPTLCKMYQQFLNPTGTNNDEFIKQQPRRNRTDTQ